MVLRQFAHRACPAGLGAKQVEIANFPGNDLDLLSVYRNAATALEKGPSKA